jgi:hypothetical protein
MSLSISQPEPRWWSVPQALAWIMTRNDVEVGRVPALAQLYELEDLGLQPLSLVSAPVELIEQVLIGRIVIHGCYQSMHGMSRRTEVQIEHGATFRDHVGTVCLASWGPFRPPRAFYWTDLWVQVEQCKACWPGPIDLASTERPIADFRNITARARPIIRAIEADNRQLTRADFVQMIEKLFGQRVQSKVLVSAWKNVAPAEWQKEGRGRLKVNAKADWLAYLTKETSETK